MKIQNQQIRVILSAVAKIDLDVQQASARRRIIRTLSEYDEDIEAIRMELISKYAEKKGEIYEKDPNGSFKFSAANLKKFRNDYKKVMDEKIDIKIDETNKKDWLTLKDILTDLKAKYIKDKMSADLFDLVESLQEIIDIIK